MILQVVDPRDGSTLAWLSPRGEGAERLRAGLSGRLQIGLSQAPGVVVVPLRALWLRGSVTAVLRRQAQRTERVGVQVLATAGDLALVRGEKDALREGDEVAEDASLVEGGDGEQGADGDGGVK
mgnify:CR=1 FL=1